MSYRIFYLTVNLWPLTSTAHVESRGYPVRDFISNAVGLCNKMMLDYEGGVRLAKNIPAG